MGVADGLAQGAGRHRRWERSRVGRGHMEQREPVFCLGGSASPGPRGSGTSWGPGEQPRCLPFSITDQTPGDSALPGDGARSPELRLYGHRQRPWPC